MADAHNVVPTDLLAQSSDPWQQSVEQARAHAKQRFRERLERGEKVGNCSCHDDEDVARSGADSVHVVGVRFRDSGRVYFFRVDDVSIQSGAWVVVRTSRGEEAARVVVAPRQMILSQLEGDLRSIERVLNDRDVEGIEQLRTESSRVVKRAGELARGRDLRIKVVAAEFSLDGSRLAVSYSAQDQNSAGELRTLVQQEFPAQVEMRHVGPRDEARLIGGLGKCGRTLCCSSWLPMYPEVTMGMVKNQELSLNPSKVSGLCGRLLCCLSYENEQYRKAKQVLPRLGQRVITENGPGMVVSLQILKEVVTVRYDGGGREETMPASELLRGGHRPKPQPEPEPVVVAEVAAEVLAREADDAVEEQRADASSKRRRRRRGRRARPSDAVAVTQSEG